MRTLTSLACVSLVSLLSACATPDNGYYDANGNWIPYNRYNRQAHDHSPLPGGTYSDYYDDDYRYDDRPVATTVTTYRYDRAGYYDYNGYYVNDGPALPDGMFPRRGMCRVWLPNRSPANQPPVESCNGIRGRVPAGAYVIYGG